VKLNILAEAEQEIESARRYLNEQSAGRGGRFLNDLESTLEKVLDQPLRFGKLETLPDSPYRRALLKHFRYAVVFEVLMMKFWWWPSLIRAVSRTTGSDDVAESNYSG